MWTHRQSLSVQHVRLETRRKLAASNCTIYTQYNTVISLPDSHYHIIPTSLHELGQLQVKLIRQSCRHLCKQHSYLLNTCGLFTTLSTLWWAVFISFPNLCFL